MAKKKCYAVKNGRKTGIFSTWAECEESVKGYPNATYKGFATREEAEDYLGIKIKQQAIDAKPETETGSETKKVLPEGTAIAYVDGSYNKETRIYGSGVVLRHGDNEKEISKSGHDEVMLQMWNVAGEVTATMIAIEEAIKLGCQKLTIYFDYNGIAGWVEGCYMNGKKTKIWVADKEGAKRYKDFAIEAKKQIELEFVKVKAHSGDKYNNKADSLAKAACGIS